MAAMIGPQRREKLILVIFLLPYFIHLGTSSLWDANEAFYVEGPREMLEAGDWLSPRFNFDSKLNKPILPYGVVMVTFTLLGISERSERLVIASCLVLAILLIYALGRRLYDRPTGLAGAIALASSVKFLVIGRRSLIDALLTALIVAALYFFVRGLESGDRTRAFLLWAYVMMGLAVLTKGLLGIVLPGGIVATFLLWQAWCERGGAARRSPLSGLRDLFHQGLHRMRELHLGVGLPITLLTALPWYALMTYRHGWTFLSAFILGDHIERFLHGAHGIVRPWWYYVPVLMSEFAPWSFFLPAAGATVFLHLRSRARERDRPQRSHSETSRPIGPSLRSEEAGTPPLPSTGTEATPVFPDRHPDRWERADRFLLAWMFFVFVFFSLSASKQNEYLLPLYPAAALLVGRFFTQPLPGASRLIKALCTLSVTLMVAALMSVVWATVKLTPLFPDSRLVLETASVIVVAGALLLAGISIVAPFRRVFTVTAATMLVITAAGLWLLPELERYRPVKPLAERIRREATADDLVGYYRFTAPSLCYYTRRKIFEAFTAGEITGIFRSGRRVFCLMYERDYRELSGDPRFVVRALECRPSLFPMTMRRFRHLRRPEDLERVCLITTH
jgi:4-amino-4-deoxy-L-arabinose transferase-like glycosyltransferase